MNARTLIEQWLIIQAQQGHHLAEGGLYALDMRQLESLVEAAKVETFREVAQEIDQHSRHLPPWLMPRIRTLIDALKTGGGHA